MQNARCTLYFGLADRAPVYPPVFLITDVAMHSITLCGSNVSCNLPLPPRSAPRYRYRLLLSSPPLQRPVFPNLAFITVYLSLRCVWNRLATSRMLERVGTIYVFGWSKQVPYDGLCSFLIRANSPANLRRI